MDTRLHRNPCGNREAWKETGLHRTMPSFPQEIVLDPSVSTGDREN